MRTVSNDFKNSINQFGRELDNIITYEINEEEYELGGEELNSISLRYEGSILKSVMKQLDVDSNIDIPIGTEINYRLGVKVRNNNVADYRDNYDYVDYGKFIVYKSEKQEDMYSYKITCYDKMLYSMKDYENSNITYPITIRNYINAICTKLGLTFANASDTFANYDKEITKELYLSYDNETDTYSSLDYKFRDVLDELAEVTASTICINEDDELEIRYINETVGKNLLKVSDSNVVHYSSSYNHYDINNNTLEISDNTLIGFKVKVQPSTQYTAQAFSKISGSSTNILRVREFSQEPVDFNTGYITQTQISLENNKTRSITVTTNQNTQWILFVVYSNSSNTKVSKMQFELGATATTPELYGYTINEEYLKDINVNFGEKFGAINTIVLSRSAESDNIYYPSTLPENPIEIKIIDNQIMNGNDREDYLPDIYNKLNGLQYYINDFSSIGICFLDLCDKYNVSIGENTYSCILFNDEVNIEQGIEEIIHTEMPDETNTEYSKADSTDRKINGAYVIANKAEANIQEVTRQLDNTNKTLNEVVTTQDATSRAIEVISTHIDANGNITEVTTITGFTFNADGMTISNNTTNFSALHRSDGTYYKDGDAIVGQYTKDGSKQKDLSLFGVYYYGMNEITDTPKFVAQLYTDNNNEIGFGHFWNGGDY